MLMGPAASVPQGRWYLQQGAAQSGRSSLLFVAGEARRGRTGAPTRYLRIHLLTHSLPLKHSVSLQWCHRLVTKPFPHSRIVPHIKKLPPTIVDLLSPTCWSCYDQLSKANMKTVQVVFYWELCSIGCLIPTYTVLTSFIFSHLWGRPAHCFKIK